MNINTHTHTRLAKHTQFRQILSSLKISNNPVKFPWEAWSPHGWCARLQSERFGFEPWPGTLCCALGRDTLLSQCLSPPRCINGYRSNCWGSLTKLRGSEMRWTSSPSRGSRNTSSCFMLQKLGYAPAAMSQPWLKGFTVKNKVIIKRYLISILDINALNTPKNNIESYQY